MTNLKRYTCAAAVLLCFCSAVHAQRAPNTTHLSDLMSVPLPDSYVALAGEGTFSTYGAAISFPVYWVEDRVKIAPLFGLMWQNFVDEGFNVRPAAGAKVLYYFQKKQFGLAPVNSFYAGLGGMGTINQLFGTSTPGYSRSGVFAGYNVAISQALRVAPELFMGANESGNFRADIGFTIYFGR